MGNAEDKAEITAIKTFDKKIAFIITIGAVIFGCAAAFYSVTARVSVLESRTDQIEDNYKSAIEAVAKYQDLANSINSRLSNIEGFLGATGYKAK